MILFGDDDDVLASRKIGVTDLHIGDCREVLASLADNSIECCVTSPPYFSQRDYQHINQIGLEKNPDDYIAELVDVFREVRRVLRDDGTLWLNLGDSYARTGGTDRNISATAQVGSTRNSMLQRGNRTQTVPRGFKSKDLIGIPWAVAFALRNDGWWLRSDIIWHKNNCMPESTSDRPTSAHEHVFLFSKSPVYFYDADAIREPHDSAYSRDVIAKAGKPGGKRPKGDNFNKEQRYQTGDATPSTRAERAALLNPRGRNARNVWSINTKPFKGAHFATMPPDLVEPCILAGTCAAGHCSGCNQRWRRKDEGWEANCYCELPAVPDVVLDPFAGTGTTAYVAQCLGRNALLIELNADYAELARQRLDNKKPFLP